MGNSQESKKVLLIDNHPDDVRRVGELLEQIPERSFVMQHTDSLASGQMCLTSGTVDIILLDPSTSDSPNLSAVEQVCSTANGIPVVALTGHGSSIQPAQAVGAGAQDCLTKSELTTALLDRVLSYALERTAFKNTIQARGKRFLDFIETLTDGVVCVDSGGAVRFHNEVALAVLGCSRTELIGKPFRFPIGESGKSEIEISGNGTAPKTVEMRVVTLDWDGEPVKLVMLHDITGRRQGELEQHRLRAIIDQAQECIVITNPEGRIEYVNPAFERLTGYGVYETIGRKPSLLKSGRQDEAFYKTLWETITRGEVWQGHFVNKKKDGTLYEEDASISPIFNTRGEIVSFAAVKRDVTEIADIQRRLNKVERLESVGQLAGGIAHDFNNVLQAVMGHAQLAQHEDLGDEQRTAEIEEILKSADRAAVLTRQLLAFSRQQTLQPVNLNLTRVIESLMKMLRRVIGENITIEINTDPALAAVYADPGQIEQVIMNLCINARDAMPQGGRIVIEADNVYIDQKFCSSYPCAQEGHHVRLTLTDTGQGIPAEVQEHIFEPFFTTKAENRGTGLGLATVYGIIKQHKGLIDVRSRSGQGTQFVIYLPAVEEKPDRVEKETRADSVGGSETVLFADDEEPIRIASRRLMEKAGYRVLTAENGLEALELFKKQGSQVDLIVLDVIMPEMSGVEVYERIKMLNQNVPILFTSGYSPEVADIEKILKQGIQLLQKPYRGNELLGKIRQVLGSVQQADSGDVPNREEASSGG